MGDDLADTPRVSLKSPHGSRLGSEVEAGVMTTPGCNSGPPVSTSHPAGVQTSRSTTVRASTVTFRS